MLILADFTMEIIGYIQKCGQKIPVYGRHGLLDYFGNRALSVL